MQPSPKLSPIVVNNAQEIDFQTIVFGMRARMARNALPHINCLDARTTAILAESCLVETTEPPTRIPSDVLDLIDQKECASRVHSPLGPLIFYSSEDPAARSVIDAREFLFLKEVQDRTAALEYFIRLTNSATTILTPATEGVLADVALSIRSSEPDKWLSAALRLYDALSDDFFLCLAGFVQSNTVHFQEGSNKFLTVLLRPSLPMVESIPIQVHNPCAEREKILQIIAECREKAGDIGEACANYFKTIGYLPLDHTLGIGRVIDHMIASLPEEEVWHQVWGWADQSRSPLARYHACLLFLEQPSLLPENRRIMLRDEILEVIHGVHFNRKESVWSQAWRVRCDLARHYAYYLECLVPGLESERIANLAWWLSNQVGGEFGQSAEHLALVHAQVVLPAMNLSSQVWQLVRPGMIPSPLRYATLHVPYCWSFSLLCQLGQFPKAFRPFELMEDRGPELRSSLIAGTLGSFPPPQDQGQPPTYAFDRTIGPTAEVWIEDAGKEKEDDILRTFLAMSRENSTYEAFGRKIGLLPDLVEGEQLAVCQLLRVLAYCARLPEGSLWEFVIQQEWLVRVLSSINLQALELFLDALIETQLQEGGRWTHVLPHQIAVVLLDPTCEYERSRLLLVYAIIASLADDSTGAVARILHSENRVRLEQDLAYWLRYFERIFVSASPWAQSRLRSILSLLSFMQGNPVVKKNQGPVETFLDSKHSSIDSVEDCGNTKIGTPEI